MKRGMILEGGAMRGMFTAGVLDVMMEHGIELDGIIGVSAGAAFGCNYKSHQIGRVIRYTVNYSRDPRYGGIRSLIKTGDLYGADFCYHVIPEQLDLFDEKTYQASPIEFYVTCTDVETGEAVYHKCETTGYDDLEWIRASASMPIVSRIVSVDGRQLLDGGIADSIPLKHFMEIGYDKNIVILTQPKGYVKKKNQLLPLMRVALKKYPKAYQAIANRHNNYNDSLKLVWEEEKKGNVLVICPEEALPVSRTERDPEKLKTVYQIGRTVAEKRLEEIKKFFF